MSYRDRPGGQPGGEARRREREARRRRLQARRRAAAGGLLVTVIALVAAVVAVAGSGNGGGAAGAGGSASAAAHARAGRSAAHGRASRSATRRSRGTTARSATTPASSAATARGTGVPGNATVPILMYHVINPPPAGAPYPGLYVPAAEFTEQMQALKAAGWHAVTMDQLEANWTRGAPLGAGKPIVISFDNGYASQYNNALPILRRLGWVGVENIQLTGLPPSQGGLTDGQVRGLIRAGWELDTQGISHADLITLTPAELSDQVLSARHTLRRRYGVAVNWFCYPSGHYNATVIAEVKAAGYIGSTTVVPGWANRREDPYRLPRLRVLGGTTGSQLLAQIAYARSDPPPAPAYGGPAGTPGA